MRLQETAQIYMQQLADDCGDGVLVALGGRDDMSMTYAACTRAVAGIISLQLNVGSRISLARTAMGRAYIVSASDHERNEILHRIRQTAPEDELLSTLRGISEAEEQIKSRGFYANFGGWQAGVNSIAVPYVSRDTDTPTLVFNLGGPAYVLPAERLENELGPKLIAMVQTISRQGL